MSLANNIQNLRNVISSLEGKAAGDTPAILEDINTALTEKGAGTADVLADVPEQIGSIKSYADGYEQGEQEAIENLPVGYLKVDPTWTNLSYLCTHRPSMPASLKYSDTANATNLSNIFNQCDAVRIPRLDYRKATDCTNMFIYSSLIEEIGEMDIPNVTALGNAFRNCYGLKRISFVNGCIKCSVSFAQSNLLEETAVQSIVDGLADLTGSTSQTLTLHADVGAKLTEAQKATIAAKNWTVTY